MSVLWKPLQERPTDGREILVCLDADEEGKREVVIAYADSCSLTLKDSQNFKVLHAAAWADMPSTLFNFELG